MALLGVLLLVGTFHSQGTYAAPTGGPGYASAVGPAFQPRSPTTDFQYFSMQVRNNTGTGYFVAPIDLPQGAVLNEMTLLGFDDDPANNLTVRFYRAFGGRGFIELIATLTSATATTDFELSTATDPARSVVDNAKYGYYFELDLPAAAATKSIVLSRARIGYGFGTSLPIIQR